MLRALISRDYLITRSYPTSFALDVVAGVIYLAAVFFISRTFGHAGHARLDGARTYFAFASVGVALGVVLTAATIGLTRRVREEQLTGTLEATATQPIASAELSLGLAGFPFVFALGRGVLYLALAAPFMDLDAGKVSWIGAAVALLASGAALVAIGVVLGAIVLVFKRSEGLAAVAIFGLSMLGGALFPISVMPAWLRALAEIAPTRLAYDGVRAALFHGHGWARPALTLVAFSIVAMPLAVVAFGQALALCRRQGTLAQY